MYIHITWYNVFLCKITWVVNLISKVDLIPVLQQTTYDIKGFGIILGQLEIRSILSHILKACLVLVFIKTIFPDKFS